MIPLPAAAAAWNTPTLANLVWRTQAPQLHFLKTHKAGFIHKSWFWALLNYFCSFSDVLSGIPGVWAENCKLCLAAAAAHTKNTSGLMYSVTCSLTTFNQCFRDLHFNVFLSGDRSGFSQATPTLFNTRPFPSTVNFCSKWFLAAESNAGNA